MDAARKALTAGTAEAARPVWADGHDGAALREFLRKRGCDGMDAVMVTMRVVGCGLPEAQAMFFAAPCRADELRFHDAVTEGLEKSQGDG
ncbi:hypothetical protein [Streptomyces sp. NK15101]|uniref:hypothetical protein n=1 Tax=Streptomyces sp. NK15101 TaxID=2873261 RepID=UPI001CEC94A9|nr:hypothetical protein [Streptomyces sp. NK15101]